MTPLVSHTQLPLPTQVSLVATTLPGTSALRAAPDAVSPSMPDAKLGPDYKGNGGYASQNTVPATITAPPSTLSVLIPANLSTSSASLSATAMFATQALSQEASGGEQFFSVYEALVAASQVKYKPSNATLPEPATNSLFSKMLAEEQSHSAQTAALQQAPKNIPAQAAVQTAAVTVPKPVAATSRKSGNDTISAPASALASANHAYVAASSRNKAELEGELSIVEPLVG